MDPTDALKIIDELAAGRNPVDGEYFHNEHICQEPDVIRALHAAARALRLQEQRDRRLELTRVRLAPNAGKPWSLDEDNALHKAYRAGGTIPELAHRHRRTIGAIRSRLEKLGLDPERTFAPQTTSAAGDRPSAAD